MVASGQTKLSDVLTGVIKSQWSMPSSITVASMNVTNGTFTGSTKNNISGNSNFTGPNTVMPQGAIALGNPTFNHPVFNVDSKLIAEQMAGSLKSMNIINQGGSFPDTISLPKEVLDGFKILVGKTGINVNLLSIAEGAKDTMAYAINKSLNNPLNTLNVKVSNFPEPGAGAGGAMVPANNLGENAIVKKLNEILEYKKGRAAGTIPKTSLAAE